jgi:transposase-like protein
MQAKSKLRLTARQRKAAILLAEGDHSVSSIAKKLGIDRTTLHNWKNRPDFQALANQIQEDAVTAASAKLASLFVEALRTYEQLLRSKSERIRLTAADKILDRFPGLRIGPSTVEEIIAERNGTSATHLERRYKYAVRKALGFNDPDPDESVDSQPDAAETLNRRVDQEGSGEAAIVPPQGRPETAQSDSTAHDGTLAAT